MTQGPQTCFSQSPVMMVYQMTEVLNQTDDSLQQTVQMGLSEQKGIYTV